MSEHYYDLPVGGTASSEDCAIVVRSIPEPEATAGRIVDGEVDCAVVIPPVVVTEPRGSRPGIMPSSSVIYMSMEAA